MNSSKREIRRWMADVRANLRLLQADLDRGDMEAAFESAQQVACSASELAEVVFDRRLRLRPAANPYRSEPVEDILLDRP